MRKKVENVASLELCMELYRLSGWNDTYFGCTSTNRQSAWVDTLPEDFAERVYPLITPAFDLGYLLRKFPRDYPYQAEIAIVASGYTVIYQEGMKHKKRFWASIPEDAAAQLAIWLFQQGILKVLNKEPECPEGYYWNGRQCLKQDNLLRPTVYEREGL